MTGSVLKENELKALNIADDFYRSGTLLVHTAAFVENGNPFLDALQTAKKTVQEVIVRSLVSRKKVHRKYPG